MTLSITILALVGILTIGLAITLIVFIYVPDVYMDNIQLMRKLLYFFYFIFIAFSFVMDEIHINDWKILLQWSAIFLFLDLSILQTPNILKFGSTEFSYDVKSDLKLAIKENDRKHTVFLGKLENYSNIIIESRIYFQDLNSQSISTTSSLTTWDNYKKGLKRLLMMYLEKYDLILKIHYIEENVDESVFNTNCKNVLQNMESTFSKPAYNDTWRTNNLNKLLLGEAIQLMKGNPNESEDLDAKVFLIKFSGQSYDFMIGITGEVSSLFEATGIDAKYIANLCELYDINTKGLYH